MSEQLIAFRQNKIYLSLINNSNSFFIISVCYFVFPVVSTQPEMCHIKILRARKQFTSWNTSSKCAATTKIKCTNVSVGNVANLHIWLIAHRSMMWQKKRVQRENNPLRHIKCQVYVGVRLAKQNLTKQKGKFTNSPKLYQFDVQLHWHTHSQYTAELSVCPLRFIPPNELLFSRAE